MVTYLLLRDNKQLGPLTLEELTQKGLRAYDLIWVESRSAAWRYPSEIEELKAFAPMVEEQPFDRFFKRPGTEKKVVIPSAQEIPPARQEPVTVSVEKQYAQVSRVDKKIYVTLPARAAASPASAVPVAKKSFLDDSKSTAIQERIFSGERNSRQPERDPEGVAERNQGVEKKQQNPVATPQYLRQPVLLLLGMILLLGAGIVIGMYINRNLDRSSKVNPLASKLIPPAAAQKTTNENQLTPQTTAAANAQNLADNGQQDKLVTDNQTISDPSDKINTPQDHAAGKVNVAHGSVAEPKEQNAAKESATTQIKKAVAKGQSLIPQKIPISDQDESADPISDAAQKTGVATRNATHRSDEISDKTVLKTNIADMVGLSASDFSVGTFGGISNLQITVSNHSVYALDLVVVEVQYIQANKKIFKTENVYFHNVTAGAISTQDAPKSPRGIKVQYKVVLINSKESGLSYTNN